MKLLCFLSFMLIFLCFCREPITAQTFTRGHYTGLDNQQYKGQVSYKIGQNYFHFRESSQDKEMKLKPEQVQNFVWGIDSFIVREESFVRVLIPEGTVRLYRDDKTGRQVGSNPVIGESRPGFSYIQRTFLVERSETGELLALENKKKKKFIQQVSTFFADAPALVRRVEKGEFGPGDVRKIVQIYNEQFESDDLKN